MCATSICQRRWPKRRSCGAVHLRAERRFVRARNYDGSGNRTQQETPSSTTYYNWDTNSRLTSCEPPAGTVTMMYDTDGRRTQKQAPSAQSNYLYDFQRVLRESDGAGHTESEYTAAPVDAYGDLISEYEPATNTNSYHAYDGLGSTEMLLDDHALATDAYANRAFGLETHVSGGSATPYTFVGQKGYQLDPELDLYYVRERYFDYATGQWVSEDPLGYKSSDIHLYRYCFNDPVNKVDPSGLAWYEFSYGNHSYTLNPFASDAQGFRATVAAHTESVQNVARDTVQSIGRGVEYVTTATGETFARIGNEIVKGVERAAVETFNFLLERAGLTPDSFWQTVNKLGDVLGDIIRHPDRFFATLVDGLKGGFTKFAANLQDNLKEAGLKWLFGKVAEAGIHLPEKFDFDSAVAFFL
jgi:RHS repeat-associated protein